MWSHRGATQAALARRSCPRTGVLGGVRVHAFLTFEDPGSKSSYSHQDRPCNGRTCDVQTESGDDATRERETEAHKAWGGWRLERNPGKGPHALKADARHPTPPRSQLNPPEGRARGRTLATLSSPRDTKIWDLCKPQAAVEPAKDARHEVDRRQRLLRWGSPTPVHGHDSRRFVSHPLK